MRDSTIIRLVNEQLTWYPAGVDREPRAVDSEDSLEELRQFAAQPGGKLCFAAPGTEVTLMGVEFSASERKHINKALPFTLEEQLVSDIDDLHISSELVGKTSLCAAVCATRAMEDWQERLAEIPAANEWIPEPLLLPWQAGEWTIVLEPEHAIVRTGNCSGFSIERDLLPDMLEAAYRDAEEVPGAVIVYGQDQEADEQLLPEDLREAMQWRGGDLRAALLLSQDENVTVNLRQGEFAHRLPLERWWRQWRIVAALFAAAFCLQLVSAYAGYVSLERENLELRRQIEESYRSAFPRGALVDPEKQLRQQLGALRGTGQSSGFVNLMEKVGVIIAKSTGTRIASINYNEKGGEIRMNITASDFEAVEAVRTAMTNNGLEAVMENSNVQGDQVRARLRVGEGS